MSKTISVTLPQSIYKRLEETIRSTRKQRSRIVQQALTFYFDISGPDARVVKRWKSSYDKIRRREAQNSAAWLPAQSQSLGQP